MTATATLQLIDEAALTLESTLASLLPERSTFPNAEAVTVRHLLSMRSRTFDLLDDESVFGSDHVRSGSGVDAGRDGLDQCGA